MPILIDALKEADKGRKVMYTDFGSGKQEEGIIKSWNYRGIFVDFGDAPNAKLCSANMLDFMEPRNDT
jgi:hypothetical protein